MMRELLNETIYIEAKDNSDVAVIYYLGRTEVMTKQGLVVMAKKLLEVAETLEVMG